MAEMELMFSNLGGRRHSQTPDPDGSTNRSNELKEKLVNSSKPKKQATVKPISAHDEKTLDTAIAMAMEFSSK